MEKEDSWFVPELGNLTGMISISSLENGNCFLLYDLNSVI